MTANANGPKVATNKIVSGGVPSVEILKVETATNMYPGRLVKMGTNDDDIVLNNDPSNNALGWLGYEHTPDQYRPATISTIYVAADQVAVLSGGGFYIKTLAVDTSGNVISKGNVLIPTATLGGVKKKVIADASYNLPVAVAAETVTIPAAGSIAILVRSLI
jgi:hypothetical protein